MSESEKNDGVRQYRNRLAGKKGYVVVATAFTLIFGGPVVDVVITATSPTHDELVKRIEYMEHNIEYLERIQALECRNDKVKFVYHEEDEEE
mgnify:CR=1 FL=1